MISVRLVPLLLLLQGTVAQQSCPPELDYGKCTCVSLESDDSVNVTCVGKTNSQVQESFANAPNNIINSFELVPVIERGYLSITKDLLAGKKARNIFIASCPLGSLEINPGAFDLSKDLTRTFTIRDCSIGSLDWQFINGFNKLATITLKNVQEVQSIQTLPLLESVNQLAIIESTGLEDPLLRFPGSSIPEIQSLILYNNTKLNDESANQILSTLTTTALQSLTLTNSPLITKVPENLKQFSNLKSIAMSANSIQSISANAFNFISDSDILIDLDYNQVATIEKGAFSLGNYGKVTIKLESNQLTSFDPYVFLEVLDEMYNSNSGGLVSLDGNDGIICNNCQLAWLIRDNPGYMKYVLGGYCSDLKAPFEDVDPGLYGKYCKSFTLPTSTTISSEPSTTLSESTETEETTVDFVVIADGKSDKEPNTANTKENTFIYVIIVLSSFLLLALVIGLKLMLFNKYSKKKKFEKFVTDGPERLTPPATDTRKYPAQPPTTEVYQRTSSPVQQISQAKTPTPVVILPRPILPFSTMVVVQGPGGKYYAKSTDPSMSAPARMHRQIGTRWSFH